MSTRYNLLSPELKANPYPAYAEMRLAASVCQVDPGGMWAVSRHDDVMHVLKNPPQLFSSQGFRLATNPPWLGGNPFSDSMLTMDPPEHGRLRALVTRAFVASAMTRMEPRVRAGRLALGALFDRCGGLSRGPAPMTWHRTLVVRGPGSLPLVLHPA